MHKAAFLDRDGVINIDHAYVHTIEAFDWVPGVLEAAARLYRDGWQLVVVTNQSGIGRGYYTYAEFNTLCDWMKSAFEKAGAPLAGIYSCPHHTEKGIGEYRLECRCRKPEPGMLLEAAGDLGLDLTKSIIFGDKPGDMTAGWKAGCAERILLGTDAAAMPAPVAHSTQCFTSLLDAVNSAWYQDLIRKP